MIFSGGGKNNVKGLKDILQYNKKNHTWEVVGMMKDARAGHAVAVLQDVSKLCP